MSFFLSIVLLAILPFQFAIPFWGGGYEVPLARVLAFAVILLFLGEQLFRRQFFFPVLTPNLWLGSFLLWSAASLLWVTHLDFAFPKIAFLFNLFPLFLVWQCHFQKKDQAKRASFWFLGSAALAAVAALGIFFAQFLFGVSETFHFLLGRILPFFLGQELAQMVSDYPSLLVNIGGETWLRATAFFPDPHVTAFFFGMSGFFALGFSRLGNAPRWSAVLPAIFFLADSLTFSRGGYIGLLFGGITYWFLTKRRPWPLLHGYLPLALGALLAAGLFFGPPVFSRFLTSFTGNDASSTERIVLWTEALRKIGENPVFGTGIGNYLASAHPLAASTTPFYAHNLFFDITLELGIVGSLFFFGWVGWAGIHAWWLRHTHPLAPSLIATIVLYLTHSLFETALFSLHVSILLVFVIALTASLKPRELVQ